MTNQVTETEAKKPVSRDGLNVWQVLVIILIIGLAAYFTYEFTRPKATPLDQAVKLVKQGKAAFAIPMLEKLTREEPDNAGVYPWLAQGYLVTERYAEGRTALDTALRLKLPPDQIAPVVQSYAEYYQRRGDFDEAEKLYRSATTVTPPHYFDNGRAQLYLAWAETDIGNADLNEAIHHLQLADSLSSGLDKAVKSKIPHKLADCYRRQAAVAEMEAKDDAEAILLLEKSLAVCDEPLTRIALASIYARTGKSKKAIENYDFVAEQDPNNLEVRHHLIDLLLEAKDFQKAQEALTELTDREKSLENYELLADINLKIGNYAGAVRALEEATALRPSVPLLEKLRSSLLAWSGVLASEKKTQESTSVKGHADRVSEQLALLKKELGVEEVTEEEIEKKDWDPAKCPIAILFSRNWLVAGSLTPEGKMKIKNISGAPVKDLYLTAVFYDNTSRKRYGEVNLPVATENSPPFEPGAERWLYFSCPYTVRGEHQLAVIILWKGKFLREFPVVKRQ